MPAPTIDQSTSVQGWGQWEYWQYQPYATDSSNPPLAISNWAATGLPAGMTINATTGLISGAATVPGVFVVELRATNSAGVGRMVFPIGITPRPGSNSFYPDVEIDVVTREVTWPGCVIKLHDHLVLQIAFKNAGAYIEMALTGLRFVMKKDEAEEIVVKGNQFTQIGAGTSARYLLFIPASLPAFAAALSDEEDAYPLSSDASGLYKTAFDALAEFSWTVTNATGITSTTPAPLPGAFNQSSQTFVVLAERDMEPTQS